MEEKEEYFIKQAISWWKNERRDFPWRRTNDPYRILITEILLRKTTANQVNSIYHEFFREFPSIHHLAVSSEEKLEKILYPLGMEKKRSKELSKLSIYLVENHRGQVPANMEKLLELHGVGRYTAGGVLCQAYKKDTAMVDTNVVRVMIRYFGFESSRKRPRDDSKLWDFVEKLIPKGKCRDFNLGVIDFATAICISKKPKCEICPLNRYCDYFKNL